MNNEKKVGEITVEGAGIIFRNFSGKKSDFNEEGNRNFGLLLDEELAENLKEDGWNVKYLKPRPGEEDMPRQAWLPVKVKYGKVPPIAVLITSRGKTRLDESTINQLDWARIKNVDLIVRPYQYPEMHNRPAGIAAYLKSIYVTIQEDALEEKYGAIPDADSEESLPFVED